MAEPVYGSPFHDEHNPTLYDLVEQEARAFGGDKWVHPDTPGWGGNTYDETEDEPYNQEE